MFGMRLPRPLLALLVVFVCLGSVYSIVTPIFEASDELRHVAVIDHLRQGHGLPIQDPANRGFYEQEGSQPPLYYALMSVVSLPFDLSDLRAVADLNPHALIGRADTSTNWNMVLHTPAEDFPWRKTALFVHVARLIGVLLGAITVAASWRIAGMLVTAMGTRGRALAGAPLLAAALTANPMFLFISASVNNDTLAATLSALAVLFTLRALLSGLTLRRAVALGIVLGAAALTKVSGAALCAAVPLVLTADAVRQRRLRPVLGNLLVLGALAAGIAGWWYVRNWALYGEPTGTTMMSLIAGPRAHPPGALELLGEYEGFSRSYLGLFGAVNIPLPEPLYATFNALLIAAGCGLLVIVAQRIRFPRRQPDPALLPGLLLAGVVVVALTALIRWTSITPASQGRLLFPTITAISTLLAVGALTLVTTLAPRAGRLAAGVMAAGILTLSALSPFLVIAPAYATPNRGPETAFSPAQRTELRYGEHGVSLVRWLGVDASPARVRDGDVLRLTFYWQGLQPMDTNYSFAIKVFGPAGEPVSAIDLTPGRGMWQTRRWVPGEVIVEPLALPIQPGGALPDLSELRVDVTVYRFDVEANTQTPLAVFDGSGAPTGRQQYAISGFSAANPVPAPTTRQGVSAARVGDTIGATRLADQLVVTTTWYVTQDLTSDARGWTVFMHLVDAAGKPVTQADGPPLGGRFPVRWWRVGDVIIDTRKLPLPAGLAAGEYRLLFGLYRPDGDFARMPATGPSGRLPDDALAASVTLP